LLFILSKFSFLLIISSIILSLISCTVNYPVEIEQDSFTLKTNLLKTGSRGDSDAQTHLVVPGDTLYSIAFRYGLNVDVLSTNNGLISPFVIKPGQQIHLKASVNSVTNQSLHAADSVTPAIVVSANHTSLSPNTGEDIPANDVSSSSVAPTDYSQIKNKTHSSLEVKPRPAVSAINPVEQKKSPVPTKVDSRKINQAKAIKAPVNNKNSQATVVWQWPSKGSVLSGFGGGNGLNKGVDLRGAIGEPVLAAASGQVVYAGSGLRGYGNLLIIKHNQSFLSAYAHNHKLLVGEGSIVKAGQKIAEMGSSGTDRVKLHFEIRRDGSPVDPLIYLPRR
jgi:lipoprotein NlpD